MEHLFKDTLGYKNVFKHLDEITFDEIQNKSMTKNNIEKLVRRHRVAIDQNLNNKSINLQNKIDSIVVVYSGFGSSKGILTADLIEYDGLDRNIRCLYDGGYRVPDLS